MTSQAEESKHITPEMCAVLRYLGAARLLERQGLIVLQHCLSGHYAARLTPAGAEVLRHMAVVCRRCGKLGSYRKSTNLEGGSGVTTRDNGSKHKTAGRRRPFNLAATGGMPMQSDSVYRIFDAY
jgi:hypothetical protein